MGPESAGFYTNKLDSSDKGKYIAGSLDLGLDRRSHGANSGMKKYGKGELLN